MAIYRRVTYEDRCQILAYLQVKVSILEISKKLGFSKGTIYREIKRNSTGSNYNPVKASELSANRYLSCRRRLRIDPKFELRIESNLKKGWSPEQIVGRCRLEKVNTVSYQTIYNHIKNRRVDLRFYLRRHGKRGAGRFLQRKYRDQKRLAIKLRPVAVNRRSRMGDWERDGMYVANKKQLLVLTERKSRFTKITKMKSIRPVDVTKLTRKILKFNKVHTITNDNGPEFRDSKSLPYPAYHCEPGKPQQRGTVENTIGLLRQYLTNKTELDLVSTKELLKIQRRINLRPRKCLNYRTPYEVLKDQKVALAI